MKRKIILCTLIAITLLLVVPIDVQAARFVTGTSSMKVIGTVITTIRAIVITLVILTVLVQIVGILGNVGDSSGKVVLIKHSIMSGVIIVLMSFIVEWIASYFI